MATVRYHLETPSKLTGPEFMEFGPRDAHKHVTDTIPHLITKCDNVKGDGEPGTIRDVHFVDGHHHNHLRMHTDDIDMENYEFKCHILDGGLIGKKLSAARYVFGVHKNESGKWIFKVTGELTPLPGVKLTEEDIENEKKFWITCIDTCGDYIEKNPDHGFGKGSGAASFGKGSGAASVTKAK